LNREIRELRGRIVMMEELREKEGSKGEGE